MTDPILFLDFDGVVNTYTVDFCPTLIERVNRIVESVPGTKVVISSNWRLNHSHAELIELLHTKGARFAPIGVTPDGSVKEHGPLWLAVARGVEVEMWREENKHTGPFCILDDTDDMGEELSDHLILTEYAHGVQEEHVAQATTLLWGGKLGPWL